ncbi:pesticin C-terminus-like muramidase [Alkalimonas mucilaginosa]|uniref:Pesticin C-terminus-like muramidase n=1 Tax=Alkalimonas mucilaginosa TaxID=3057676 RepID=A0ABU7JDA2_9GAMM|nr:pesticin C-terminus-like muramidase [Alkalimonas sp. MEB004]MEE2023587.1 pesticin C-terminus-like muramidase [Alkalimonas sp. MEB004]
MHQVDFDFIAELEGKAQLKGYVPDPAHSNSGVTIATGFDIGQRSESDIINLLPEHPELVDKLVPYCGLKRIDAVIALQKCPLLITREEAGVIDSSVKNQFLGQLQQRYNAASMAVFTDLPAAMQTVIASVAFQYGDLARRCPKFWRTAVNVDSTAMINELKNFGDRYPTRRNREANYLQKYCQMGDV